MATPVDRLFQTIQNANIAEAKVFINNNRSVVNQTNRKGLTPLLFAILKKREELVQCLLEVGADPDTVSEVSPRTVDDGETITNPIHAAISAGSAPIVRMLLHHGAKLYSQSEDLDNIMSVAVRVGDLDILDLILQHSVDKKDLQAGLNRAITSRNFDVVKWLVKQGADVNGETEHVVPLVMASEARDIPMCRLLLSLGASLDDPVGTVKQEAPVVRAVMAGLNKAVETLIELGCNVNATVKLEHGDERIRSYLTSFNLQDTVPILQIAVMKQSLSLVNLLLRGGCDVNALSLKFRISCLHVVCKDSSPISLEILQLLLSTSNPMARQSMAEGALRLQNGLVHMGRGVSVEGESSRKEPQGSIRGRGYGILRGGLKSTAVGKLRKTEKLSVVNSRNFVGQTPLQIAMAADNTAAVQLLLNAGADLAGAEHELTGLIHRGQVDIIEMLLSAGLNPSVIPKRGETNPLVYAAKCGDLDICQLFLDAGADVNVKSQNGDSLLHLVVRHKNPDMVQYFLELGCPLDGRNETETTPLMLASRLNSAEVCTLLVHRGANMNLRDQNGETALSLSVYFGEEKNGAILLKHGANPDLCDNRGSSPIYWAIFNARIKMLRQLLTAGAKFSVKQFKRFPKNLKVMRNPILQKWMISMVTTAPSLQHLCRLSIRENLKEKAAGRSIMAALWQIQCLPASMLNYLAFQEWDNNMADAVPEVEV